MELEAFKEELNQPTVKPAFKSRQITTEQEQKTGKLVHQSSEIGVNKLLLTIVPGRSLNRLLNVQFSEKAR